ncbi:hypothetical protein SDC9_211733 [bioreactor metagenome]|uniref:Uncharacterized protein n=1 Tax=bioreactor metagenome TaxID=1076179 RepID=A0A645JWB6_9ZZZZ
MVHGNDFFALLGERFCGGLLHILNNFFRLDDTRKFKERGLKNRVHAPAEANLFGNVRRVDGVELNVVLRDKAFHGRRKHIVEFLGSPGTVE